MPGDGEHVDIVRAGRLPPEAVAEHTREGAAVAAHLKAGLTALVEQTGEPYGGFLGALLDELAGAGHLIWHVGGGVRDLIADGAEAKVRDLDFAGTAPVGSFSETVRSVLALADASGNVVIAAMMAGLRTSIESYVQDGAARIPDWDAAATRLRHEHRGILDAIDAGDPERARTLVEEQLHHGAEIALLRDLFARPHENFHVDRPLHPESSAE